MKRHLFILMWLFFTPPAWAQAPFYEGKTITVIAGVSAGSAYDLYARLMAQFMGKHIAGNPSFVVQNMTGAGSIIGANYVYNVSKPDGLTNRFRPANRRAARNTGGAAENSPRSISQDDEGPRTPGRSEA